MSNNTFDTAINLGTITDTYNSGNVSLKLDTYYKFTTESDGTDKSKIELTYDIEDGDLDLQLFDASRVFINSSSGAMNEESISLNNKSAGTYYIRVFPYRATHNIWAGTSTNIAKPVTGLFVGVDGVAKSVSGVYVGVDNKAKKIGGNVNIPYNLKIIIGDSLLANTDIKFWAAYLSNPDSYYVTDSYLPVSIYMAATNIDPFPSLYCNMPSIDFITQLSSTAQIKNSFANTTYNLKIMNLRTYFSTMSTTNRDKVINPVEGDKITNNPNYNTYPVIEFDLLKLRNKTPQLVTYNRNSTLKYQCECEYISFSSNDSNITITYKGETVSVPAIW
jgi:hypothetical protein